MASKNKKANNQPDHITLKYVKKAGAWVKTICAGGKFKQEWTSEKAS